MTTPPANALKILVVDDTATNRQILQVFLKKLGFTVLTAEDGAQAVASFKADKPDVILMDVMMPVMDGYEATRQIKALSGTTWIPIIFVSALDKEDSLVAGLDAGGDDYLFKPVNLSVLDAKLRSLRRTLDLHRSLDEARLGLQRYRDQQEEENQLAQDVMLRQMMRDENTDHRVQQWLAPAANFSGDIAVAATSPKGGLYALLADATGHGLAAAISALPVLSVFHGMVKRDLPVSSIISEINVHLRNTLRTGRFVAVNLLYFDSASMTAEVWMGGMPEMLQLGADGQVIRRISSSHLPLGVIDLEPDMLTTETIACPAGSQFVMFSDGLVEAESPSGEAFGEERMQAVLASGVAATRLQLVRKAVNDHLNLAGQHDDISLLLVDCH
jgi:DNA-binding response OmpR family regulator